MADVAALRIRNLAVRSLRNLLALELDPAASVNLVVGDNGQGKTSLLEAIYLVATTKSFRSERLGTVLRSGDERATVRAVIEEDGLAREQRLSFTGRSKLAELEGKRAGSLAAYATRTPVVVFHPADLELVSGPAADRRKLLDRILLFLDLPGAAARQRYLAALSSRQRVLEERGTTARDLTAFEAVMAESGARFARARKLAAEALTEALTSAFGRIARSDLGFSVRHVPGGTEDGELFARELFARRHVDQRRRGGSFGPQRDELELELDGRAARHHASQGQQRLLTLALKLSELECVRRARGAHPVLLLDDVSSELDPARTFAVYDYVRQSASQIFVTTTRPELFAPGSEYAGFRLSEGRVERFGAL